MRSKVFRAGVLAVCITAALAACESRVSTHGNLPDPARVKELKPGNIGREEIAEILGSPSSINTFGPETWYYISERTETFAFFAPEVKERQILVARFDKKGALDKLEVLDLTNGRQIAHVERVTPTFGEKLTVLGQIIGNFQRFTGAKR